MADNDDKVWVTGLEDRFPQDHDIEITESITPVRSGQTPGGGGRQRKGPDLGFLLAVFVGVFVGVGVWFAFLRPPAEPDPVRYVVEKGDTLWHIARFHGVQVAEIETWNGLSDDSIEVGQILLIYPPGAGDAIEATDRRGRTGKVSGGRIETTPSAASGRELRMPDAKPCLAGPDEATLGENGLEFAASAGLSYTETKAAMDVFLPRLGRCVPEEGASGTASLELTVGCSGRVAEVRMLDSGGLPADMVSCVRETLRYAEFPAHDIPDGFTFAYPLTFDFSGG